MKSCTTTRRQFLSQAALGTLALAAAPRAVAVPAETDDYDIVVIGGTPGGIAAAVTAARLGHRVALAEYHPHLGAMSASGLGKSDIEHRAMIQGFFREFVDRVKAHYVERYGADSENVKLCRDGYFYEPSVAEKVFDTFVQEQPGLTVLKFHQFEKAHTIDGRITSVDLQDRATGQLRTLRGKAFIDATYEGDVYASAGAKFRLGREGRDTFGEPHAGEIIQDWRNQKPLGGSGLGDDRLPAYTYRLCLTANAENTVPLTSPPPAYDRTRYLGYLDDYQSGNWAKPNLTSMALSIAPIPNRKTDVNMNPRSIGFVFVEDNKGYIEGTWAQREEICARIRHLTLGLLWFLQNDDAVPAESRALARKYHLSKDEFADHEHFPFQLYVREARRLVGEFTLSERNITEQPGLPSERTHADVITVGEYPIDSFPMRARQPGDTLVLEGYLGMMAHITPALSDPLSHHGPGEARWPARPGGRLDHPRRLFLHPPRAHLDGPRPGRRHRRPPRPAAQCGAAPRADGRVAGAPARAACGARSAVLPALKIMKTPPLTGIIPPLITPLHSRDALDVAGLERLVEHVLAGGVHGLFVLGTTGEAPSLSYRLRRELIERVCRQVAGRVPVLVGITDTAFVEAVHLAQFAAEAGAQALVLAPPYYFPNSQPELLEYVQHLAPELPLPLFLYNMPTHTKTIFDVETVRCAMEIPNIVGLKDSSATWSTSIRSSACSRSGPNGRCSWGRRNARRIRAARRPRRRLRRRQLAAPALRRPVRSERRPRIRPRAQAASAGNADLVHALPGGPARLRLHQGDQVRPPRIRRVRGFHGRALPPLPRRRARPRPRRTHRPRHRHRPEMRVHEKHERTRKGADSTQHAVSFSCFFVFFVD